MSIRDFIFRKFVAEKSSILSFLDGSSQGLLKYPLKIHDNKELLVIYKNFWRDVICN